MKLYDTGVYLQNGQEIIPENQADLPVAKEEAAKNTIAYSILLSLIHISEPTRRNQSSRMTSSA